MRRVLAALAGTAVASLGVLGLGGGSAVADSPTDQGWWWVANQGDPAPAPPTPPDVPADGLLVQGGQTSPSAYAGLIYELPKGASADSLTLKVATSGPNGNAVGTVPNATLELCPLTKPNLATEQGGPMADAPAYKCAQKVDAGPSSDGLSYTFKNLSALTTPDGYLAVAITPTAATDRVVLSKPDASSLTVTAPLTSTDGGSGTSFTPGGTGTTTPAGPTGAAPVPAPGPATGTQPAPAVSPVVAPAGPSGAAAPAAAGYPTASTTSTGAKGGVVAAVLLVALVGAFAWAGAGNAAVRAAARRLALTDVPTIEPEIS
jgi:hypothetical protein